MRSGTTTWALLIRRLARLALGALRLLTPNGNEFSLSQQYIYRSSIYSVDEDRASFSFSGHPSIQPATNPSLFF
jgi:hypothetical protein